MTHFAVPPLIDISGRSAALPDDEYIRALIGEVLMTQPGERLNRPDFGSGLLQLILAPADPTLAATTQLTVQSALQRWLGDLIEIGSVQVDSDEESLRVLVVYSPRGSDRRVAEEFGWSL
ncbi:GPW/gp25 family protein [Streptomyces sp. NPDC056910]|uniref:GPW/gp25 family protein n=1 Tax=Streptomyces sp. NPDC056910 TaxID=3345964 RepID=UPI0036A98B94